MYLQQVPLKKIDLDDTRFRISTRKAAPELAESMKSVGLIQPPLLRQEHPETLLAVVCGYQRVCAAASLAWSIIPALILEGEEVDPRSCLLRSYHETLLCRKLSIFEKAALAQRLIAVADYSPEEVLRQYLPALELPPNQPTLDRLLTLDSWPESIKAAAQEADLAPRALLALADRPQQDVAHVVSFLAMFRWTASRQCEILSLLIEAARLRKQTLAELATEASGQLGIRDDTVPLPQRAELVRRWLRRQRYPLLLQMEDSFLRVHQALRLGPRISWQGPVDFEGEHFKIQFQFKNRYEYEEVLAQLQNASRQPEFDDLFRFL